MSTPAGVTATIGQLASAYRSGALSPVEVTRACLDRIAARDGEIRAFATVTADRALDDARAAERALRDDPDGVRPLLGIPVGVKDIVDTAGIETAAGSAALAGRVPATSATVWQRLEDAGAVLVGKTRTHELAYGVWTPPTRNPWDTARIPGGSSGGSAAALAAGMCAGAVGSDTAGSIRIPANLCGVAGIKPTYAWCPADGVWPLSPTLDHVGPMARTVGDLAVLLAVMAGHPVAARPAAVRLEGTRIGLLRTGALLAPLADAALDHVAGAVTAAGAVVEEVAGPSFAAALEHADHVIAVEAAACNADLLGASASRLDRVTRVKLERGAAVDRGLLAPAREHAAVVRRSFAAALAGHDVLLAPGVAVLAPAVGARAVHLDGAALSLGTALCHNMAACNLAGVPAVALPAGTADGLPVGVQLIGPHGGDAQLLAVATALAEHLPGGALDGSADPPRR